MPRPYTNRCTRLWGLCVHQCACANLRCFNLGAGTINFGPSPQRLGRRERSKAATVTEAGRSFPRVTGGKIAAENPPASANGGEGYDD